MTSARGARPAVERARREDAAALARIAAAALPEPWSEGAFADEIDAPGSRVWIARDAGGAPIAYLALQRVLDELHLVSVAVGAAVRRSGIGSALWQAALGEEAGATVAYLEVRGNDAGAQAFYTALGFAPIGSRRGFYPGGIDAVTMRRALAPTR